MDAPTLSGGQAAEVLAVLLAHATSAGDHAIVRTLARLAPGLDYPDGVVYRAYLADEYLDCECHPDGRRDALAIEEEFRAKPPLQIPHALLIALVGDAS